MAETTTITRPAPIIEGSLTAFLKSIDKLGAGAVPADFAGIDPSKYAPKIAAESQLQQDARTAAGGLGALTGPQAYQQFMSPYQQEVIDTTLSEFDRQQTIADTARRDQAIQAGAYGGGREDGNSPSNFGIFKKNFSKKNVYDRFSVVTNREPIEEYYGVIIPDYVSLSYSCVIFTDYIEQMNKIVEAINFASDSYWGDPEKFSFRAMIDNYTTSTELAQGQDRAVKTNFNINMIGHIVSDSINASIAGMNKFYSKSSVTFGLEVAGTLEELSARARTAEADTAYRFFDQGTTGVQRFGMTREQIEYLNVNNTAFADSVLTGAARFDDKTIVEPPSNFSDGQERFSVYINGTVVPNTYTTITQQGTDILVQVQTNNLGYRLDAGDEVVLVGKFK